MAVPPTLKDAAGLLHAGRALEAVSACEKVLAAKGEDAAALHIMGIALTRLARPQEALVRLRRAAELLPDSPAILMALGDAHRCAGEVGSAREAFEGALRLQPTAANARFRLGETLADLGEMRTASRHFGLVALANPMDFEATHRFVGCVASLPGGEPGAPPAGPRVDLLGRVVVGMCTVQPERAARARASLEQALAPTIPRFDIVTDARSLAEAFNRILDRADGDVVILCHDDIEVLSPSLHEALADALRAADIVGVAGADRAAGPAVFWAGHPHVHGRVSYPRGAAGFEAAPMSLRAGLIGGMQTLDGVFIAMTRRVARELRFDAATFDGFHFYDLDFTYRAARAGFRLAVATDLLLLHASEGRFEGAWAHYAARFQQKFPELASPAGSPHWYGARFGSRDELRAFYSRLDAEVRALQADRLGVTA